MDFRKVSIIGDMKIQFNFCHKALCFILPALLLLISCSRAPITGRRQVIAISSNQMSQLAANSYQEILSKTGVSENQEYANQVSRVGKHISEAVQKYLEAEGHKDLLKNIEWDFKVLKDSNVNAFAMPGGKVAFYEGIMPVCDSDAGVAVVMGHEIAHIIARHSAERMTQALALQMGGLALNIALKEKPEKTRQLALAAFGIGSQVAIALPFSRTHEKEADELGLYFLAYAGYDPMEAPKFWEKMMTAGKQAPPEFLSTHPSDANRIKAMKKNMDKALSLYASASIKRN